MSIFSDNDLEDIVATIIATVLIGIGIYWLFIKSPSSANTKPPVDCNAICYPNLYVGYSLDKKACICDVTRIMKDSK